MRSAIIGIIVSYVSHFIGASQMPWDLAILPSASSNMTQLFLIAGNHELLTDKVVQELHQQVA